MHHLLTGHSNITVYISIIEALRRHSQLYKQVCIGADLTRCVWKLHLLLHVQIFWAQTGFIYPIFTFVVLDLLNSNMQHLFIANARLRYAEKHDDIY